MNLTAYNPTFRFVDQEEAVLSEPRLAAHKNAPPTRTPAPAPVDCCRTDPRLSVPHPCARRLSGSSRHQGSNISKSGSINSLFSPGNYGREAVLFPPTVCLRQRNLRASTTAAAATAANTIAATTRKGVKSS